ncbi:hypothetical protein [Oceanospirillum sanctuarii]|uniref:hypothetical protein n=1 Tax=Oceanospirillum sanctuarii TaxID=1434821 RepID=UPI000A36AAA4|nr:hypothetical protein [Oceanospirillum sanctuarii]
MISKRHSENGWTLIGVLGVILSCALGAAVFSQLALWLSQNVSGSVAVPWLLVSLFMMPLTITFPLLLKLWELKDQQGMSRSEVRRLKGIIEGKTRQLYIAIGYYMLSAVTVAIILFLSSSNLILFKVGFVLVGGLLGISLFSVGLIINESHKISEFKSCLEERSREKKQQEATLKRLNSSDD